MEVLFSTWQDLSWCPSFSSFACMCKSDMDSLQNLAGLGHDQIHLVLFLLIYLILKDGIATILSSNIKYFCSAMGFPHGSVVKNLPTNAGDTGSTPGSGRSPEGGNGYPLWYSCLENPMNRDWRG